MVDFIKFDQLQGAAVGRKWTKRVQNEWKNLQNSLPGTTQHEGKKFQPRFPRVLNDVLL